MNALIKKQKKFDLSIDIKLNLIYNTIKKQKNFDLSIDIELNLIYNTIIKGKEKNEMSKKKKAKKKLSTKDIIELIIKAVIAIAALIQAIKS